MARSNRGNKGQRAINSGPILFSRAAKLTAEEKAAEELAGITNKLAHYRSLLAEISGKQQPAEQSDDFLFGENAGQGFSRAELEAIISRLEREAVALQELRSADHLPAAGKASQDAIHQSVRPTPDDLPPASSLPESPDLGHFDLPPGHMLLEADWQDLSFQNGYISIRLGAQLWSGRFPVAGARAAFGKLRGVYRFRGAAKLLLLMRNREIRRVLNREVLDYYLRFLEQAESLYSRYKGAQRGKAPLRFEEQKAYFSRHLPQLFRPECFDYLHRRSSETLPTIPLPELVINSDGSEQIHDSFLFPVEWKDWVFVVWESTETSKASYCFQVPRADYETRSRRIYDYLSGTGVNKRATLYAEKELRKTLGLTSRVFHKGFEQWKGDMPFG